MTSPFYCTLVAVALHIHTHSLGGFSLVFLVKGRSNKKYALKRMAVNNDQDLFAARQEIAITVSVFDY